MSENYFDRDGSRGYGDGHSREGRGQQNGNSGRFSRNNGEHTPRQRFSRPARPAYGTSSYGSGDNDGRGSSSYRPRFNSGDTERGQRQEYRPRFGGGDSYAPRENRFGKSRFGGRDGGFGGDKGREGGFRPRFNSQEPDGGFRDRRSGGFRDGGDRHDTRGGYQSQRGGYGRPQRNYGEDGDNGGFRPRFRQDGGEGGGKFRSNRPQRGGYDPNAKYSHKKRMEYKEANIDPNQPIRLNRYLANAGICSRRDADKYIEAGVVSVNGKVVTELGTKVMRTDEVRFHNEPVKIEKKVYVLLNKPKGYVTTSEDPENRKTVMDLVQGACPERIYPVGRLDRNTTGVLLLTNDGDIASKLTHPKFLKKKIYHVTTDKSVAYGDLQRIAEGIELEDGMIKADEVAYAKADDKKEVGIEIHSGRNRIVRRIFEHLGYHVVKLDRVYFAGLTKKNVRRGDWRYLTEKEVAMLHMGAFE